ncbi:MAG: hypothetical protein R3F59_13155 [Myxococcota bacterium]
MFVVLGDQVYPGTADKNLLQVSWTNSTDSTYSQEHDAGYDFSVDLLSETDTTITLTKGEKGAATGTFTVDTVSSLEYAESDRWRPADVGVAGTQLPSTYYLVGDQPFNVPNSADCADNDCKLTVDTSCTGDVTFAATFAGKYENGMFGPVNGAAQSAGDGGGLIITPPGTTSYYGY